MHRRRASKEGEGIRVGDETLPVIDRRTIGGRRYLILKRLGRRRMLAFAPQAAMGGALRLLHLLPKNRATRQQVQVLARLDQLHASFPILLEHHVEREEIILVTKWTEGIDLQEYLKICRAGGRPWPSAVVAISLFRKLAHGISQLHDRLKIVHGDIHPGNVLLGNTSRTLILVDFGSAWIEPQAASREEGDGIQEFYAAPEMKIPGAIVSERSDHFSLLVLLYEFLTGELPFDGIGGKAGWSEFREHFSPQELFRELPLKQAGDMPIATRQKIAVLFQRGLTFDPANRFPSSRDFRNAFDAIEHDIRSTGELLGFNRIVANGISWLAERFSR